MCRATMRPLSFVNIKRQLKVIHDVTGMDRTINTTGEVVDKEESEFETDFFFNANRGSWRSKRGSRINARGHTVEIMVLEETK